MWGRTQYGYETGLSSVMSYAHSFLSSHRFKTWSEPPLSSKATEHKRPDKQLSEAREEWGICVNRSWLWVAWSFDSAVNYRSAGSQHFNLTSSHSRAITQHTEQITPDLKRWWSSWIHLMSDMEENDYEAFSQTSYKYILIFIYLFFGNTLQ